MARRFLGHGDRSRILSWFFGCCTLCASAALAAPPALETPVHFGFGVATESPTATRDAASVLNAGGSAIDGAIVAALVAGVTAPTSSGLGGGGFALFWSKDKGANVLDFRETAPASLVRAPFEERPLTRERVGHLVGTPGEVRGLWDLHQRGSNKTWKSLVDKAIFRAKNGFFVGQHLGSMLLYAKDRMADLPGFSSVFYKGGKPALVGQRLVNPTLARTLEKLAALGPDGFYEGTVAADIVAAARAHGGTLSLLDLKSYRSRERKPLLVPYDDAQVYTMPPPSAGGLMMVETLKMFPAEYLRRLGHGTPAYQHVLAEAMRSAVADRMRALGDPDFEKVDLDQLLDDARLEKRRARIALDLTHSIPRFGLEESGTHAIVTSDRQGNVVSLTTTVNRLFGSKIYAQDSGVILNDELNDFTEKKDVAPFGMADTPNRPRPLARPVSSMTPTIVVRDGEPVVALGGSGGTAIATNATQTLLAHLVFGHAPQKAVSADRIYIPTNGAHVLVEKGTPEAHVQDLERRGEVVGVMPFAGTAIQMLSFEDGHVKGGADPRKHGLARTGR